MINLVQLQHPEHGRRVARVEANELVLLEKYNSAYELAWESVSRQGRLSELIEARRSRSRSHYDAIYTTAVRPGTGIDHWTEAGSRPRRGCHQTSGNDCLVQAYPQTDGEKNCLNDAKKIIDSMGRENMANSCKLGCCGNSTIQNVCLNLFLKIYFNVRSPEKEKHDGKNSFRESVRDAT